MANRYVWTPADQGPPIDLSDWAGSGYGIAPGGTTGLRSVEYSMVTQTFAGIDGASVQAVRAEPNTASLGMYVLANDAETFQSRARALVRAMRPKAGPGTLTVTSGTGVSRSLDCYVTAGLEGDMAPGHGNVWKLVLKLFAPDPWWYGQQQTITVGLAAPTAFFPITPVVLSASSIQGQFTVDLSTADAPSFPVWTVTGPGAQLRLTNVTTGREMIVNAAIGDGQSYVIDTRRGFQSVRLFDGTNLMGSLASDPALWPLVEGVNVVSALLTNAGSGSRITGVYSPRFSGI